MSLLAAIALLLCGTLTGQSFTQTVGGALAQDAVGAMATSSGYTIGVREYDSGVYIGRTYAMSTGGAFQNAMDLSTSPRTYLQGLANAADGSAFLFGSSMEPLTSEHYALLVKLADDGSELWSTSTPPPGTQFLGACAMPDGGAVACGLFNSSTGHDVFVSRFDASGNEVWNYTEPSLMEVEAHAVAVEDNALLITGRSLTFSGTSDVLLVRLTTGGSLISSTTMGGALNDEGRAAVSIGSGSFAVAGWTDSYGTFDQTSQARLRHAWVLAMDADGDTLWTRTLGDTLFAHQSFALSRATNGDLFVAGERYTSALSDAYLARLDINGVVQWQRTIDTGKEERLLHLLPMPDDGVVSTGWSFGPFGRQVLFIRRSALGF